MARSHFWLLCTFVVGALGLTLLGGCRPSPSGEAEPRLVTREHDIKIANSLSTQALVFNGISTNAQANKLVRTNALKDLFDQSTTSDADYIRAQLADPNAREFMKYLVGCALAFDQTLPWQSTSGHSGVWEGGAGLCPNWLDNPPSDFCLRQVSSCILARNNAVNRRVELSFRGQDSNGNAFDLDAQPLLVEYDPDVPATDEQPVASLQACESATTGVDRKCGWTRDHIGSCEPYKEVWLGAGGQAAAPDGTCTGPWLGGSTYPETMLRVCEGIIGCNDGDQRFLAQKSGSCGSAQQPAVSFTCPGSGYFNVMTAPVDSSLQLGTVKVEVEQTPENAAAYPLSEAAVFRFREGAFYGNLFTENVAAEVTVIQSDVRGEDGTQRISSPEVKGSVYPEMYVCHDPTWNMGAAYATHRVCALPGSGANCAATVTGSCRDVCGTSDAPPFLGDHDYGNCSDDQNNTKWNEPVTVFLYGPCDLMPAGMPDLCARHP